MSANISWKQSFWHNYFEDFNEIVAKTTGMSQKKWCAGRDKNHWNSTKPPQHTLTLNFVIAVKVFRQSTHVGTLRPWNTVWCIHHIIWKLEKNGISHIIIQYIVANDQLIIPWNSHDNNLKGRGWQRSMFFLFNNTLWFLSMQYSRVYSTSMYNTVYAWRHM
jgi:hypothetical protein